MCAASIPSGSRWPRPLRSRCCWRCPRPGLADAVDAVPRPTVMLRVEDAPVQNPAVLDGVRPAAAAADVPVTMTESFSRRADTVAMVERMLSITRMMSLVALVIALVGIANTVFLSWRERRRDRALANTFGLTSLGNAGVMAFEMLLLTLPEAGPGGSWGSGPAGLLPRLRWGEEFVPLHAEPSSKTT